MTEMDYLYAHPNRRSKPKFRQRKDPRPKWSPYTSSGPNPGCFHRPESLIDPEMRDRTGHEHINQLGVPRSKAKPKAAAKEMHFSMRSHVEKKEPFRRHVG